MQTKKYVAILTECDVLRDQIKGVLFLIFAGRDEWKVLGTTASRRIGRTSARNSRVISAIHAARRQTFSMNRFNEDPRYLLR
jgi:hypothetical protein